MRKPFLLGRRKMLLLCTWSVYLLLSSCAFKQKPAESEIIHDSFRPGEIWQDTEGVHINAHGGGILKHEGRYYWFGEHKSAGRGGNTALVGIRCYSSDDLYNWKNEGVVLSVVDDPESEIVKGCIMERPKVIHNRSTGKFVMWFHLELKDMGYSAARTAVAVSDQVTGPYIYLRSYRVNAGEWPLGFSEELKNTDTGPEPESWTPEWITAVEEGILVRKHFLEGQMSRDMTLFVDDDGKAYHIHASEENLTLHISELTADYLEFTGKWKRILPAGHNEAPAICKRNGKYYLITSGCTGWEPNPGRSAVAESIWGPWISLGNPFQGENADLSFHSQSTFLIPYGESGRDFIYMGDRWRPTNPIDGRYIWLPVRFENEKPVIEWLDDWDLSSFNSSTSDLTGKH
jgi:hypothetical protein